MVTSENSGVPAGDPHQGTPGEPAVARRRRSLPARVADGLLILILVAVVVSQIVIWNFWDSAWGDSLKNLITYSQRILVVVLLLGWWFLFGPTSLRKRLLVGIPIVLLLAGWVASIRRVEFTGDMVIKLHYRWEPTAEAALAAHRAAMKPAPDNAPAERQVPELQPEDMPAYRGIHRDGVVIGPPLNQDWQAHPPRELWRHPVGGGYSSISVVGPLAVTLEQRGPDEAVVCYDVETGRELWEHRYPSAFDEAMGGPGPRSTPTIDGDAVYSFGAWGDLFCLHLLTGQQRWHVNALQQFGIPNATWGMTSSPLLHEGQVIVNIGGIDGNGLVAYHAADGRLAWHTAGLPEPKTDLTEFATGRAAVTGMGKVNSVPGYASPVLVTLAGQLQILNLDGKALRGHDPQTGQELWSAAFENDPHVNVAQPIVFDDGRIFLSASYDVGARMVQVSLAEGTWSVRELWSNLNMRCKFTSPVLYGGDIYGLDEGLLVCLNPADGQRRWKGGKSGLRGRYGHGQLLLTGGQILALTEQGEAVLIIPSPDGLKEVTSMRVLPEGKNWNPPALVRGRLLVRSASEMACFDIQAPEGGE